MHNLYDMERHRLKLYGEMLKKDLVKQKEMERLQREEKAKQASFQLEQHLQNTKIMNQMKRNEIKGMNKSLQEDNKMLSTMKKTRQVPHTYAEEGESFVQDIGNMDNQRLQKLKRDLHEQANEHHHQLANRRIIEDKIRQIQNLQDERHRNRIKQWNIDSVRNYQEIKRKHQQNMNLYDKHRRLQQENDYYRDELQSFTHPNHGHNLLDRYNRNQYNQRKANLIDNQAVVKQQMADFQRRKSQQLIDYKKSVGDLQHSMLKSVLVKPRTFEPLVYTNQLKNQMWEQNQRKSHQKQEKRQKVQLNNIYGGVHGREREGQIKQIDQTLGLSSFASNNLRVSRHSSHQNKYQNVAEKESRSFHYNPEKPMMESASKQIGHIGEQVNTKEPISNEAPRSGRSNSGKASSRGQYKSFDVISGKNKFYNVQ